jgi:hypothetical protein
VFELASERESPLEADPRKAKVRLILLRLPQILLLRCITFTHLHTTPV